MVLTGSGQAAAAIRGSQAAPAPQDPPQPPGTSSEPVVVETETKVFHNQIVPLTQEEASAFAKKQDQKKKHETKPMVKKKQENNINTKQIIRSSNVCL